MTEFTYLLNKLRTVRSHSPRTEMTAAAGPAKNGNNEIPSHLLPVLRMRRHLAGIARG